MGLPQLRDVAFEGCIVMLADIGVGCLDRHQADEHLKRQANKIFVGARANVPL
jgi:hypothetical protein